MIEEIANKIKDSGGVLYLVGGAIRDKLLGNTIEDEDYCVVGIEAKKFEQLFPEAHIRGKDFSVYEIDGKEFALARTEKKSGIGHKEFSINTKNISIEEDLKRRDLTINAMAQNVLTGELIDPFQGREDLKNKRIKAIGQQFSEDPLRVYRAARFAASMEFEVEENTIELMNSLKSELEILSKERVFEEFRKALACKKPSIFFEVLKKAGVLEVHFKEIADLIGAEQPIQYHPEGDSFNHTMLVVDKCAQLTSNLEIRFSSLVHDLGKGVTPREQYPHHYGHDKNGVPLVLELGKRVGVPNRWMKCGKIAAAEHMRGGLFEKMRPSKKVEFIERANRSLLGLEGLQIVVIADRCGRGKECEEPQFAEIGKQCITEVNGETIKQEYPTLEGIALKEKLQEERIKWMKKT